MVAELPEGTVTILFTDVVDSTALAATVGDRLARDRRACANSWRVSKSRCTEGGRSRAPATA
jgi:class 3 adenylate cyclase